MSYDSKNYRVKKHYLESLRILLGVTSSSLLERLLDTLVNAGQTILHLHQVVNLVLVRSAIG